MMTNVLMKLTSVMKMQLAQTQMAPMNVNAIQVTQTPEMPETGSVMVSLVVLCRQCWSIIYI